MWSAVFLVTTDTRGCPEKFVCELMGLLKRGFGYSRYKVYLRRPSKHITMSSQSIKSQLHRYGLSFLLFLFLLHIIPILYTWDLCICAFSLFVFEMRWSSTLVVQLCRMISSHSMLTFSSMKDVVFRGMTLMCRSQLFIRYGKGSACCTV